MHYFGVHLTVQNASLTCTRWCTTRLFIMSAERKRAMCVVSVPLDIEDTLRCFRNSLAKRSHTLRAFQHSRTLLMLLLADTQHCESHLLSFMKFALEVWLECTGIGFIY